MACRNKCCRLPRLTLLVSGVLDDSHRYMRGSATGPHSGAEPAFGPSAQGAQGHYLSNDTQTWESHLSSHLPS